MNLRTFFFSIILICLFSLELGAQTSTALNWQAAVRDGSGAMLENEAVTVNFRIRQGRADGDVVYGEIIDTKTDRFGLVTLKIGSGGGLEDIDWEDGPYFFETRIATRTGATEITTNEISAVPFALFALNADGAGEAGPQGPAGVPGERGPQGERGPKGDQGIAGQDGTGISIVGTVATVADLPDTGKEGDLYIVGADGLGYVWDGRQYTEVGRIQGPRGPQGEQGEEGGRGPQGDQGVPGERGPKGDQGIAGQDGTGISIVGTVATVADLPDTGKEGDLYIVGADGLGYVWDGRQYTEVGRIQGPRGGEQGPRESKAKKADAVRQGDQGVPGERGPKGDQGGGANRPVRTVRAFLLSVPWRPLPIYRIRVKKATSTSSRQTG